MLHFYIFGPVLPIRLHIKLNKWKQLNQINDSVVFFFFSPVSGNDQVAACSLVVAVKLARLLVRSCEV